MTYCGCHLLLMMGIDDTLRLLSTADGGIDDIQVIHLTAGRAAGEGIADKLRLLSIILRKILMTYKQCYLLLMKALMIHYGCYLLLMGVLMTCYGCYLLHLGITDIQVILPTVNEGIDDIIGLL